jgi:protein associated with RNAse G/E
MTGSAPRIARPVNILGMTYDGQPHWRHIAYLLQEGDGIFVTTTLAGTMVETERGPWESPFDTRGHYWPDRWYNVIRLDQPEGGSLNGFYCNVATPAEFDGETLRYVDLQLDVRVFAQADGGLRYEIWDEDEFEAATERYGYPDEVIRQARAAVEELVRLVEARAFPFWDGPALGR